MTTFASNTAGKRKRGHPKGSPNHKSIVQEFAASRVTTKTPEGEREVPVAEYVLMLLRKHQLEGHAAVSKFCDDVDAAFYSNDDKELGILLVPETLDPDEWIRRAEIENSFRDAPPEWED